MGPWSPFPHPPPNFAGVPRAPPPPVNFSRAQYRRLFVCVYPSLPAQCRRRPHTRLFWGRLCCRLRAGRCQPPRQCMCYRVSLVQCEAVALVPYGAAVRQTPPHRRALHPNCASCGVVGLARCAGEAQTLPTWPAHYQAAPAPLPVQVEGSNGQEWAPHTLAQQQGQRGIDALTRLFNKSIDKQFKTTDQFNPFHLQSSRETHPGKPTCR